SGTWLARLNLANRVASSLDSPAARGPNGFSFDSLNAGGAGPGGAVDRLADLLLDGQIDPGQRQVLVDYLTPPGSGGLNGASPPWLDERRRGALYLALAMPEYHLS
ncbi:MAG TPA: hypothetical protein VIO35_02210, partial [Chloroflexota bacterium]